ncbi:undecaprenyldiphospho-muramoylpentapeptide beta-N-acetylglucosaminyltransferase [Nitratireductor mangrovi]|uniref:UDP-N-acetylglucosamine--N-acetylmuramyl-(pentapeptide) pyrophosphoryl-undecaprenol N-acetylglucosamine transferase n=1 Tax=Nitratireductor mangrovi TaxID=2599600 RepID=A0A5B8KUS9_9HYPH|nr:undecaprenyldiphospho-muramoylpentapeptide beta-N-acetylglucosaminyltransferase [Nitratireductor mangrovi]QDY99307.1 undecaprenyldiphospho-muramoylpentapeptide beta-N-acetylglucosaminyltransferase [Nitratireductor mangrovi]
MTKGVILLSAGGTGGHLFPAEALAHELAACGWSVHLATDDRAARYAGAFPAEATHTIASATIGSKNPLKVAQAFWSLWRGFREASVLMQRLKPKAVVGFGGYPTLPPVFAATRRGIPTVIHEQNAVMGRANKALAGRVTAIAGGFLRAGGAFGERIVETGNPVRPAVIAAAATAYAPPAIDRPFNLLVFGGSQGAQYFSEALPPAVAALPETLRRRLRLTQQARPEDEAQVREIYRDMAVSAEVSPFFTDLAERMAAAHLVISRSGASTVSEIAAIGRPAILVPYPYALDHDQAANAAALAAAGGAEVHPQAELSPERLAGLIAGLAAEPVRLENMAKAARSAGRPDATRLLAELTEAIASGRSASEFRQGAAS